jgi:hypothetical protein
MAFSAQEVVISCETSHNGLVARNNFRFAVIRQQSRIRSRQTFGALLFGSKRT